MTWVLKRTTTEKFEVNLDALDPLYMAGITETLDQILARMAAAVRRTPR